MRPFANNRLGVEVLETRAAPAVAILSSGGNLTLRGDNASNNLTLDTTSPGTVTVINNGLPMGTYELTGNLTVSLGNNLDTFFFLTPTTNVIVPGKLTVNLGGGDDAAGIASTFEGGFAIDAGSGNDFVQLGQIVCDGSAVMNGGTGFDLFIDFPGGTKTYAGNVQVQSASAFLTPATSIAGNLTVNNTGENSPVLSLDSAVGGSLTYAGGATDDVVILFGSIGGNLSASMGGGANTLSLGGLGTMSVLGSFSYAGGNGVDTVLADLGTTIGGSVSLNLSGGANVATFASDFFAGGRLDVLAGSGANVITFASTVYNGPISIRLGGGASTVDLSAVANFIGSAIIDFGLGFGPKTYLPPGLVSGTLTLRNYP